MLIRWAILSGAGLWFVAIAFGAEPKAPQGQGQSAVPASPVRLPSTFDPGRRKADGAGIDLATTKNVAWAVRLGTQTYTRPAVGRGRVVIGTNDQTLDDPRYPRTGGGLLMCLDEATGQRRWQLPVRKLEPSDRYVKYSYPLSYMEVGICSSPTIDGDNVYVVSNRGEVLCLDLQGLANGNGGPYQGEARYVLGDEAQPVQLQPTDGDILWRFDMLEELKLFPHDAIASQPLVCGDVLYVGTGNGVDDDGTPFPDSPSLIALDKRTGRLIGYDKERITSRTWHGQWSSPSVGKIGDRNLIFVGGGDGICYAFEALTQIPQQPVALKCVWSCDCNPPEYRVANGRPIDYWRGDVRKYDDNKNDGLYVGPSEIIATPVFSAGRVYVAIGQDPEHGKGRGRLTCIDATGTGDLSQRGRLWTYDGIQRSVCSAVVADGLVYVADLAGVLHCLDAERGTCYWTYPTKQETWSGLLVADGKIYLGGRKALWILATGKQPQVLSEVRMTSPIWSPPVAANGMLYVPTQRYLFAVNSPER